MGHHELPSLQGLLFLISVCTGLLAGLATASLVFSRWQNRAGSAEEAAEMRKMRMNRLRMYTYWIIGTTVLAVAFLGARFAMINYTNLAVTYFEQSLAICGPHLTHQDVKEIRSSFASVKRREDYVEVMQRLEDVAIPHGLKLPQFTIW
jgi:hypothetical protein